MKILGLVLVLGLGLACSDLASRSNVSATNEVRANDVEKASTPSTASEVTPIFELNIRGLLGGSQDGKWVSAKEAAESFTDGSTFKVYSLPDSSASTVKIDKLVTGEPCAEFYSAETGSEDEVNALALSPSLKWKVAPQAISELAKTSTIYSKVVSDVLNEKNIKNAAGKVEQLYQVDLDGDGSNEVVLGATKFQKELESRGSQGDYSFVLLRKVVNGKAENMVVTGDFLNTAEKINTPAQYKISGIADLNGDGKMEIVVFAKYYEGSWVEVYELKGDKLQEVKELRTSCGV